jgi:signal transduction histidine kinase
VTASILQKAKRPALNEAERVNLNVPPPSTFVKHANANSAATEWHGCANRTPYRRALASCFKNITHRKNADERLYQAQKMEALGKLAGGIAHDFSNVLNAIVGYAYLLQEKPSPDKVREHATELLRVPNKT